MLLNDFFKINSLTQEGLEIKAEVVINPDHKIFEGHFPEQPVVPGVCMMQMIKEIIEQIIGKEMNLTAASEMKFLAIINPKKNNIVTAILNYTINENKSINVSAVIKKDDLIHFKFKGQFDILQPD